MQPRLPAGTYAFGDFGTAENYFWTWIRQHDAKWLDKSRQVGTSGKTVKPRVYLALGISGSFQHLGGIKGNPFIVAVNKNSKAPIFQVAEVGVAVCDKPDGEFRYVKRFRPLGEESRDIGQFIDDDGTAYLVFEDRPHGFHIARLSDDYMTVERDMTLEP